MTRSKPFTTIAALIFTVMAIIHVDRLVTHFRVVIGSHVIPQWVSILGVIVPAVFAVGLWLEARR